MARTPHVGPRFAERARALNLAGERQRACLREVARLARSETLPLPADYAVNVPPVGTPIWIHRVPGENLWLTYRFDDVRLTVVSVLGSPPVPSDG